MKLGFKNRISFCLSFSSIVLFVIVNSFLIILSSCNQASTNKKPIVDSVAVTKKTESVKKYTIDTLIDKRASILAGLELTELDTVIKKASIRLNQNWEMTRASILDPIRNWCIEEGIDSVRGDHYGVFYPFSGPDFPFVNSFYPNADMYIMAGLEKVGNQHSIVFSSMPDYSDFIKNAEHYFYFSGKLGFFRTMDMGRQFTEKGIADIIAFYLKKSNCNIVSMKLMTWNADSGSLQKPINDSSANVIHTTFLQSSGKYSELYYFSKDLSDHALAKDSLWAEWVNKRLLNMNFTSLTKSASYLMHNRSFSIVRNLILTNSTLHIQDDSGIDFNSIVESKRPYLLYGKYTRTIPLFSFMFEKNLKLQYDSSEVKPLPFKIGYNVSHGESNVLVLLGKPH